MGKNTWPRHLRINSLTPSARGEIAKALAPHMEDEKQRDFLALWIIQGGPIILAKVQDNA